MLTCAVYVAMRKRAVDSNGVAYIENSNDSYQVVFGGDRFRLIQRSVRPDLTENVPAEFSGLGTSDMYVHRRATEPGEITPAPKVNKNFFVDHEYLSTTNLLIWGLQLMRATIKTGEQEELYYLCGLGAGSRRIPQAEALLIVGFSHPDVICPEFFDQYGHKTPLLPSVPGAEGSLILTGCAGHAGRLRSCPQVGRVVGIRCDEYDCTVHLDKSRSNVLAVDSGAKADILVGKGHGWFVTQSRMHQWKTPVSGSLLVSPSPIVMSAARRHQAATTLVPTIFERLRPRPDYFRRSSTITLRQIRPPPYVFRRSSTITSYLSDCLRWSEVMWAWSKSVCAARLAWQ